MIAASRTETHAYHIPHVDVTDTQTCKFIAADFAPVRDDTLTAAENGLVSAISTKNDDASFGSPYNSFHSVGDTTGNLSDAKIHARLIHETGQVIRGDEVGHTENRWKAKNHHNRQYARIENDNAKDEATSARNLSNTHHVYEEVRAINEPCNLCEYDIRDYYKKYSPTTAKTLIDALFFARHEICKKCVGTHYSPVYTDRLIYMKKSLFAIEVVLCQYEDVSCFKYCDLREESNHILHSQYDRNRDCMLIYSYVKTNAAGILYSHRWPQDVFDLESVLKPSIHVVSRACNVVVNTQLYHRYINNCRMRISRAGCTPMTFYRDCGTMIDCTRRISYSNLENSLIHQTRQSKDNNIEEYRRNRSSLTLLEPLLLMPELTSSGHGKNKNHVLRSERAKVVRILIAYALSFFILASITFYIVYFT